MHEQDIGMQTIDVSDEEAPWNALINRVARREMRVLLKKSGTAVAAIVSMDDLRRLQQLDAQREQQFRVLDQMRAAFADLPDEEIEEAVAEALKVGRSEHTAT